MCVQCTRMCICAYIGRTTIMGDDKYLTMVYGRLGIKVLEPINRPKQTFFDFFFTFTPRTLARQTVQLP